MDIWPVAGIGVGALGLRAHLFNLGAGAGTIFYYPRSAGYIDEHGGYFRLNEVRDPD